MRDKIIKRFAAGTIGICFAYALIRQPFAVMKNPSELMTADLIAATQSTTQSATVPTTVYSVTTVPPTLPEEPPTEIIETDPATEQPETEAITQPLQEEIIEDNDSSENESDEEIAPQQNESGGDVPSLTQFLIAPTRTKQKKPSAVGVDFFCLADTYKIDPYCKFFRNRSVF